MTYPYPKVQYDMLINKNTNYATKLIFQNKKCKFFEIFFLAKNTINNHIKLFVNHLPISIFNNFN